MLLKSRGRKWSIKLIGVPQSPLVRKAGDPSAGQLLVGWKGGDYWGCGGVTEFLATPLIKTSKYQVHKLGMKLPPTPVEFALIAYSFSPATDFRDPTVILWVRSEESPGEGSDANFHYRFRCTHLCLQVALFTSSRKPVFLDFDYVGSHLYSYSGAVALQICRRAFQHFNRTKWQLCMFLTGPHSLLGDK